MSALNITGEEADPVKGFFFRELREYSKRRKAEQEEAKDQQDRLRQEERKRRNKEWREQREGRKGSSDPSLDWSVSLNEGERGEKCCAIL